MNKNKIFYGTDAKILQYETDHLEKCHNKIDLIQILSDSLFKKSVDTNCIMINLEHQDKRYHTTLKELQKLSLTKFVHLKGSYWKNKEQFSDDLNNVLTFLKKFNSTVSDNPVNINSFSETDDINISIQDGPLACYVSHLRAMIYAYQNFKDYTIICEDDINILNTACISKYIKEIPDDWDIITLNTVAKYKIHTEPWYKYQPVYDHPYNPDKVKGVFHSTHFYIINNKCLPFLFQNLYPITDQVDVLISELVHKLNIYNIQESVYQYNLETDTQNNLHVIFMSPFYGYQRELISNIEKYVSFFMDTILDNNEDNSILTLNMIYDTVYHYVLTDDTLSQYSSEYLENYNMDYSEYQNYKEYDLLLEAILYFINSAKKGTQVKEISKGLLRNILYTINNFKKYHNKMNDRFNKRYKAYDYGSTSNVYKLEDSNIIVKQYNSKLRCTIEDHDNPQDIFDKELNILKITQGLTCSPKLIDADRENLRIYIEYAGESLYRNFTLPNNWEDQINNIFDQLDHNKINYSEFWLQNILVLDNKITLVDYGLAKFNSDTNNNNNRKFFIDNLKALNPKLSVEPDRNTRLRLIRTFFDNLKNQ